MQYPLTPMDMTIRVADVFSENRETLSGRNATPLSIDVGDKTEESAMLAEPIARRRLQDPLSWTWCAYPRNRLF